MDLNLLVAFEALYRERSVTKAGRRLGLSQPAASAALAKLRAAFGDALFVKTPRGLEPTERCDALAVPIAQALGDLRDAIGEEDFDPRTTDRVFRVGAVDPVLAVLAPHVAARVLAEAPCAQLHVRAIDPGSAAGLLDARDIDLAIAPFANLPKHLLSQELFAIPFVIATRPGHPLGAAPTLAELARWPHAVVIFAGPPRTAIDDAFDAAGAPRRIGVVLSSHLAIPEVLAESDVVALLPRPFAKLLERAGRVRCAPLPAGLAIPAPRMRMIWPARLDPSRAWRWLRERIAMIARERVGHS